MKPSSNFIDMLKQPLAWLPVAMSIGALLLVLGHVALYGVQPPAPQSDEGAAAHLYQLLLGIQLPLILWFAFGALPQHMRAASLVLALQVLAWLAAVSPVFWLGL